MQRIKTPRRDLPTFKVPAKIAAQSNVRKPKPRKVLPPPPSVSSLTFSRTKSRESSLRLESSPMDISLSSSCMNGSFPTIDLTQDEDIDAFNQVSLDVGTAVNSQSESNFGHNLKPF